MIKKSSIKITIYAFVVIAFSSNSCNTVDNEVQSLEPIKTYSNIGEENFFKNVYSLTTYEQNVYFIDGTSRSIFVCNEDLNLISKISSRGRGPGELQYPFRICIDPTGILNVLDSRTIKRYDSSGSYMGELRTRVSSDTRFCMIDSSYFFSLVDPIKNTSIIRINSVGEEVSFLNPLQYTSKNKIQNSVGNWKHVCLVGDNHLASIGVDFPSIELIDLKSNKCETIKVDQKEFRETYQYYESLVENSPNMSFSIVKDTYYSGGKLYVLIYYRPDGKTSIRCNTLLIFSIDQSKITLSKVVYLRSSNDKLAYITTFCILPCDRILAFDYYSSSFLLYKL